MLGEVSRTLIKPAPAACEPANDREYLAAELAATKAAIAEQASHLGQSLKMAADVRIWAREYPWATVAPPRTTWWSLSMWTWLTDSGAPS